jgi:hypothetical protein
VCDGGRYHWRRGKLKACFSYIFEEKGKGKLKALFTEDGCVHAHSQYTDVARHTCSGKNVRARTRYLIKFKHVRVRGKAIKWWNMIAIVG